MKYLLKKVFTGPFGGEDRKIVLLLQKIVWGFPIKIRYRLINPYNFYQKCIDRDGFVVIKGEFKQEAKYMNEKIKGGNIDDVILQDRMQIDPSLRDRKLKTGSSFFYYWSINDPKLKRIFKNENLIKLLNNQYRRKTFIRENPYVFDTSKVSKNSNDITELYHLDGLNQISVVLFLNTLNLESTHMKIKMKRLFSPFNYNREKFDQDFIENNFNTFNCICEEGDLLIFDASRLYHKADVRKGNRRIMHFNIGTGWQKGNRLESIIDSNQIINSFYSKISK